MSDLNPFSPTAIPSRPIIQSSENFVVALKSIGGQVVKSAKDDLIIPATQDFVNALAGGPGNLGRGSSGSEVSQNQDYWKREQIDQEELERQQLRRLRHQELTATPIYDRHSEEVKSQIEALRKELQALAKDLGSMASSTLKAIDEEVANPGTYHLNFFEKLRQFIILLRKQINDSQNWLELAYARKAAKSRYWGNVGKSGTKFMLSSERSVATSTG